ncbi:MAG: Hpt domain [Solirubrobacterales bacterium]|jgi:chemotaxis protein histidine kinase CheA|nr:Hpt domain [Solirubrobacterales bacterium]
MVDPERELRIRFAEEAHRRCSAINSALTMVELGQGPAQGLLDIRIEAHTLKGTAAVLGLEEVSEQAARAERLLVEAGEAGALDPGIAAEIQQATAAIQDQTRAAAAEDDPA